VGGWFYRVFRALGLRSVALFAWFISSCWFVIFPRRLANSLRFYKALFPTMGLGGRLRLAWRQYHSFAALFSERLLLDKGGEIPYESSGFEHLEAASGGIMVMSHAGAWEIAVRLLARQGLDVLLFMGRRPDEAVEGVQKQEVEQSDVAVVAVERKGADPLIALEGLRHLKAGGLVSMTGDRLWPGVEDVVEVPFLNGTIRLPATPFRLALVANVPLYFFFAFRIGRRRYAIRCTPPMYLPPARRKERSAVIDKAARDYAALLETVAREHPEQWYHFE
jgi:lauroyl/myristoyl acyltransferase